MDKFKEWLVMEIGNADDLSSSLNLYTNVYQLIPEYKFVFSSPKGPYPGFQTNKKFENGASIRSLFNDENVFVMDPQTIEEMFSDKRCSTFKIDYSISLDSQAISYLRPYINGKVSGLDDDIEEIFNFISHKNTQVDSVLYELENLKNLDVKENHHKIFDKLLGYEFIKDVDFIKTGNTGKLTSKISQSELFLKTDRHFNSMLAKHKDSEFRRALRNRHDSIYAYLLMMSIIQIKSPARSLKNKLIDLLIFAHNKVGFLATRELILASEFFKRGTQFRFFNKIHKKSKNMWPALHGMAWDLTHCRYLEQAITFNTGNDQRYFFPGILSCDKGFIEAMELTPLKAVAFNTQGGPPLLFYHDNGVKKITADIPEVIDFYKKITSKHKREERASTRNAPTYDLQSIVTELEEELEAVAQVPVRRADHIGS